jgi:ABC-type arginine transport system permease subunit
VDRNTLLWTLVVFFGATVLFGAIGNLTEDESDVLRIGLQAFAGLLVVGLLVAYVRNQRQ